MTGNFVSTHFVGTKDNLADLFTKPVPYQAIDTLLNKLSGYGHTWETFPNTIMQWSSSTTVQWSKIGKLMTAGALQCREGKGEAKRESDSKREWKLSKVPASLLMSVKDP